MGDALFSPHPADLRCSVEMDGGGGEGIIWGNPKSKGVLGKVLSV